MRFFLDHDVPNDIGHLLQHWGHKVTRLRDVLTRAEQEGLAGNINFA